MQIKAFSILVTQIYRLSSNRQQRAQKRCHQEVKPEIGVAQCIADPEATGSPESIFCDNERCGQNVELP